MIPLLVFAAPYKPGDANERQNQEAVPRHPIVGCCHKNGGRPVSPADDADTCRASCHLESCPAPPNYPFEQSDDTNCGQNRRNHQQYLLLFHSIISVAPLYVFLRRLSRKRLQRCTRVIMRQYFRVSAPHDCHGIRSILAHPHAVPIPPGHDRDCFPCG